MAKGYFLVLIWAMAPVLISCDGDQKSGGLSIQDSTPLASYSDQGLNFRISLTDAPRDDFESVIVNVDSMELWVKDGGADRRIVVGRGLGALDLLKLRNGVMLPVQDLQLPADITITHIRMLIKGEGNVGNRRDGSNCDLKTPSAQTSGVKLKLAQPVTIASGYSYSLVVDFDALKSVVQQGNGNFLLKPVLRVGGFTRLGWENAGGESSQEDLNNPPQVPLSDIGETSDFEEEIFSDELPPEMQPN